MAVTNKSGTQDWFYHSPHSKNTIELAGPIVSQVFEDVNESTQAAHDAQFKRKWIRDTDTDYVRLAKEGGRKDLFQYRAHKRAENGPVLYPRCDWFDHDRDENQLDEINNNKNVTRIPEWYAHEEFVSSNQASVAANKRPLVGFDDMTIWQRQNENSNLPSVKAFKNFKDRRSQSSKTLNEVYAKLPKIHPRGGRKKSVDNGEIGCIMTYAYQKEFIEESKDRSIEIKNKKKEEKRLQQIKTVKECEIWKKRVPKERTVKPMFKLTRFDNVSARIDNNR